MKTAAVSEETSAQLEAKLIATLEKIILTRIADDTLNVPSFPEVARDCLALVRTPNFNLKRVAARLADDPVLAVRTVKAANSAMVSGTTKVVTLEQATARLGSQRLSTVLLEASAAELFKSRDAAIGKACRGLWDHSLAVGVLARDLVAIAGQDQERQDAAYLVGLLHDVGKPVVAALMLEAERGMGERGFVSLKVWLGVVSRLHRIVGVKVAERWELPDDIVAAVRDVAEYDSAARDALSNYVRFANAITKAEGIYVGDFDAKDAQAVAMIGRSLLGIDEEVVKKVSVNLRTRITK